MSGPRRTRRQFLRESSKLAAGGALAGLAGACGDGNDPAVEMSTAEMPSSDGRPNFLFFFPDQHRPDWLGLEHYDVPISTPNIARLASTGVNLQSAVCAAPTCAPSRACLAGGMEYDRCGVPDNQFDLPLDRPTYHRLLRDAGYHTMGCGKLDLSKGSSDWGLDGGNRAEPWGFSAMINNAGKGAGMKYLQDDPVGPSDPYYAYLDSLDPPQGRICAEDITKRRSKMPDSWWGDTYPSPLGPEAYCDNWVARNGLQLLDQAPADKPWHLVINFPGPHPPMDITREMERQVRGPDRVLEGLGLPHHYGGNFSEEQHRRSRQNYAAMIENIDMWLGRYMEWLEERGQLENTIIVYASDHGEMLGEHGRWGKAVPYRSSVGVPLLAAGPGVRQGFESAAPASIMDLAATFLDYGGVEVPAEMDSRSLRPLLSGASDNHREVVLSGLRDFRMAWDGRYKLTRDFGDEEWQLWDLEADPEEARNLASQQPDQVRRLKEWLPERVAKAG